MKKRYILFGYQIQNGEFCIVQQEGAAVEYIFDAYSNGDSLQQIATHMSSCGPPYRSSDNRWNKNIIARLLSCDIYCGTATYPAIITKELYFQVQQLRNEKSVSYSSVLQSFRDDMQSSGDASTDLNTERSFAATHPLSPKQSCIKQF